MRAKEYLAIVRARDGVLSLTTMRFADEIRSVKEIDTATGKAHRPKPKQLNAATAIIEELTADWEPDRFKDRYRQRLQRVVSRKSKGEEITAPEDSGEVQAPPDLMEALEQSLAELTGERKRGRSGANRSESATQKA
jgi:DNA end-binding protein Ku